MPTVRLTRSTLALAMFSISSFSASSFSASSFSLAAVAPDAGQSIRELQKQPLPAPKPAVPPAIRIEGQDSSKKPTSTERIPVKKIQITGHTLFPESALLPLVSALEGTSPTLAELEEGARRISAYYHQRGYPIARAYIPAQSIQNGIVQMAVLEGRVGQVKINNKARLSDTRADNFLTSIDAGAIVQSAPIDRALLLLSETPGIGAARATLQPGASVGSSDLLVDLDPSAPYSGFAGVDNYGNYYTGALRFNGQLNLNSPLKMGDRLSLSVVQSKSDLSYGRVAWQLPVGSQGLTLGAAYAHTHYRLDKEFASLGAHGTASIASLIATYPLVRSTTTQLSGTFSAENKHLQDHISNPSPGTESNKKVRLASLGLVGNHQDAFGGGGISNAELTLAKGHVSMDTATSAVDIANTRGSYTRLAYAAGRLQRVAEKQTVSAQVSGQFATSNLNSSEKFSLGGAHSIRAFAEGEASGDEGLAGSIAWNYAFNEALQGSVFFDGGSVKINKNALPLTPDNRRTLSGAGVELSGNVGIVQFKTSVAWAGTGSSQSSPSRSPRVWVQASIPF